MGKNEWANAMIKENPYFVEGMTPEEYDKEREYYLRNYEKIRSGKLNTGQKWLVVFCCHILVIEV